LSPGAKSVRNDVKVVQKLLGSGKFVVASIAPSLHAYYDAAEVSKIIRFLKKVGFSKVEQTSRSTYQVSIEHAKQLRSVESNLISSCCPSVVELIEKYYPDLIPNIASVMSPMMAHYEILKKEISEPFEMVFIGPCIAKKEEIKNSQIAACITFEELEEWMGSVSIEEAHSEAYFFDDFYSGYFSRYPLPGQLIDIANINKNEPQNQTITVTGTRNIRQLLESIRERKVNFRFIEAMACEGGCIMGPARPKSCKELNYYELRERLIKETSYFDNVVPDIDNSLCLYRSFTNRYKPLRKPTEEQIQEVLYSIGKINPEDELNCSACGYESCRDKAIAVLQGIAEREMCVPYMKSKAESFSKILLEANPNALIILNQDLSVVDVNTSFTRLTGVARDYIKGKDISVVFHDIGPYREVIDKKKVHETITTFNGRKIKKFIFSVPEEKIIITTLIDITDVEIHKEALEKVKNETLDNAQKVLEKQMKVTHDVAVLLGETAVETEMLLNKLINIIKQG